MHSFVALTSRALDGLHAPRVTVEVHLANGLPSFTLVGLADLEVREARERVRSAILNAGLDFPTNRRITVNLAPADLPKDSGRFDLPIALGILAASGQIDATRLAGHEFAGELSLSGELRPIRGALAMSLAIHRAGLQTRLVLPTDSASEAALVPDARVYSAAHLLDVVSAMQPDTPPDLGQWQPLATRPWSSSGGSDGDGRPDMIDVKGQAAAKRALEIAAAGGHSLLMVGPPGSGKSMLAQRLIGLLPPMSVDQALESAALTSLDKPLHPDSWGQRPFRHPHHSASAVALVGGGSASSPRPGEISLAHHGVLFLDEAPHFSRHALDALREPLETGVIHIARAARRVEYPARFQLVTAMNPCPCGYLGSRLRPCRCTPEQVSRYQGKLSGPLLDRIDLHIEVPTMASSELLAISPGESSAAIRERCLQARERAQVRQGCSNQALQGQALEQATLLAAPARLWLQKTADQLGWSARATHRSLRVARTIADLAGSGSIDTPHLAEAIQYRRVLRASA